MKLVLASGIFERKRAERFDFEYCIAADLLAPYQDQPAYTPVLSKKNRQARAQSDAENTIEKAETTKATAKQASQDSQAQPKNDAVPNADKNTWQSLKKRISDLEQRLSLETERFRKTEADFLKSDQNFRKSEQISEKERHTALDLNHLIKNLLQQLPTLLATPISAPPSKPEPFSQPDFGKSVNISAQQKPITAPNFRKSDTVANSKAALLSTPVCRQSVTVTTSKDTIVKSDVKPDSSNAETMTELNHSIATPNCPDSASLSEAPNELNPPIESDYKESQWLAYYEELAARNLAEKPSEYTSEITQATNSDYANGDGDGDFAFHAETAPAIDTDSQDSSKERSGSDFESHQEQCNSTLDTASQDSSQARSGGDFESYQEQANPPLDTNNQDSSKALSLPDCIHADNRQACQNKLATLKEIQQQKNVIAAFMDNYHKGLVRNPSRLFMSLIDLAKTGKLTVPKSAPQQPSKSPEEIARKKQSEAAAQREEEWGEVLCLLRFAQFRGESLMEVAKLYNGEALIEKYQDEIEHHCARLQYSIGSLA